MKRYNGEIDGRKITKDFFRKNEIEKALRSNYRFVVEQAYKCIQQIMQQTLFNRKITAVAGDFEYIIAYYNNKILDEFSNTGVYLPNYSIHMFLSMLLFPTTEIYEQTKNNKDKLIGLDNRYLQAKEEQIKLEKKLFNKEVSNMVNPKINNLSNQSTIDSINDFEFDLMKAMITKKVYSPLFIDRENNCLYSTKEVVDNYKEMLPVEKYRKDFMLLLPYYHDNTISINNKYIPEDPSKTFDENLFPVSKALEYKKKY